MQRGKVVKRQKELGFSHKEAKGQRSKKAIKRSWFTGRQKEETDCSKRVRSDQNLSGKIAG